MTTYSTAINSLADLARVTAEQADRATRARPESVRLHRSLGLLAVATLHLMRAYLTVLLSLLGLSSLIGAAFLHSPTAGLITLGVSLLVLGYWAEVESAPTGKGN